MGRFALHEPQRKLGGCLRQHEDVPINSYPIRIQLRTCFSLEPVVLPSSSNCARDMLITAQLVQQTWVAANMLIIFTETGNLQALTRPLSTHPSAQVPEANLTR